MREAIKRPVAMASIVLTGATAACGGDTVGVKLPAGPAWTVFRCPARVHARSFAFTSRGTGLDAVLAPAGARRARLCFYAGLNPRPKRYGFLRARRTLTNASRVDALTEMLNRFPAVRQGPSTCAPGISDGPAVVLFAYRHRPVVAITVYVPNTCFLASNGHRVRQANGATVRSLRRLG